VFRVTNIEIVSHPLCPFAQRLVLAATVNGLQRDKDFNVTYLAYPTLKDTVGLHSPTGDLPVLKVGGVVVTTTTEHAAEYIDLVSGQRLMPDTAEQRIIVRRREQMVRAALDTLRSVFTAKTSEALDLGLRSLLGHLQKIDGDCATDNTSETETRMDIIAMAPMFSLANFHPGMRNHSLWNHIPRLREIGRRLADDSRVQASRCPNYDAEFKAFFSFSGSAFPQLISDQSNAK
jgi:glutathione S-transferase